jgi:hypothetical protein
MRKVSPETVWYALISVSIVMVLGACMKPVDVESFLNDPKVIEVIEAAKEAVIVDDQTGDDLVGRDRRIEGLKKDKYYMVEQEKDAEGASVEKYNNAYPYPVYVSDHKIAQIPGGLYPDLGFITRIKDGRINGLLNGHTYTVRAAEPLIRNGFLPYTDDNVTSKEIPVTNGIINITGITGDGFLDLSDISEGTEVIAVTENSAQSSPWGWNSKTPTSAQWASFVLEGHDTTVDYVFFKKNGYLPPDFKFLRVIIGPNGSGEPSGTPPKITLKIDFEKDGTPTLTSTPPNFTYSQSSYYSGTPLSLTINITNVSDYSIEEWKYDGNPITPPITLYNTDNPGYFMLGKHTITLICKKDGNFYSADFTFEVTP